MELRDRIFACTGFDWDEANVSKNWNAHRVAFGEAEEVFLNDPWYDPPGLVSQGSEERFCCMGTSQSGRPLFVVFTFRQNLIRVISVRDPSRKEKEKFHARKIEKNPPI